MIKTWQLLNIIGFLGVLTMNYLANALPLGGRNTGEISALYPTLFTPAGFTFAIWGVIYALLAVFIFLQSKSLFQKGQPAPSFIEQIGPWFFINCVANMAWLPAWHHLMIGLAMGLMIVILLSLIVIYQRLQIGNSPAPASIKYGVHLPFSVYLAWISVASIANASILLTDLNWGRFGAAPSDWAVAMLVVGALLGLFMLFRRRDLAFALVLVWAYFGIYMGRTDKEGIPVAITALGLMGLLFLGVLIKGGMLLYKRK